MAKKGFSFSGLVDFVQTLVSQAVLDAMHPVGHVILTFNNANPSTYGYTGTWQLIPEQCTLLSSTTTSDSNPAGTNTPVVPVPYHDHGTSVSSVTLNKRFNSNSTGNHYHDGTTSGGGQHDHSFPRPRGDKNYANGSGNTWWGYSSNVTVNTSSVRDHTHWFRTDTRGDHNHYTDVNFGSHNHSVDVLHSGTSGATLDVRGKHVRVYMWRRTA